MNRFFAYMTFFLVSLPLFAHPHMQLTAKLEFEFSGTECRGFWVDWEFDPIFSASTIADFDKNRDKKFDDKETRNVHDNAFINLKNYGFFVYLRKGDARTGTREVEKFSVRQEKGLVYYRFRVPLEGKGYSGDFSVAIFDSTYFCAVKYKDPPAISLLTDGQAPKLPLVQNKKYPIYYNPKGETTDTTTYQKWKPGLETAYPEEIDVSFP